MFTTNYLMKQIIRVRDDEVPLKFLFCILNVVTVVLPCNMIKINGYNTLHSLSHVYRIRIEVISRWTLLYKQRSTYQRSSGMTKERKTLLRFYQLSFHWLIMSPPGH